MPAEVLKTVKPPLPVPFRALLIVVLRPLRLMFMPPSPIFTVKLAVGVNRLALLAVNWSSPPLKLTMLAGDPTGVLKEGVLSWPPLRFTVPEEIPAPLPNCKPLVRATRPVLMVKMPGACCPMTQPIAASLGKSPAGYHHAGGRSGGEVADDSDAAAWRVHGEQAGSNGERGSALGREVASREAHGARRKHIAGQRARVPGGRDRDRVAAGEHDSSRTGGRQRGRAAGNVAVDFHGSGAVLDRDGRRGVDRHRPRAQVEQRSAEIREVAVPCLREVAENDRARRQYCPDLPPVIVSRPLPMAVVLMKFSAPPLRVVPPL